MGESKDIISLPEPKEVLSPPASSGIAIATMAFYSSALVLFVVLILSSSCQAMVSPDPDPASFVGCGVQRVEVLDQMFEVFGVGRNSTIPRDVLTCVWTETDVVTPMLKAQIPNGIDDIMKYCDANGDNYITYEEVLATDTCIGNCGTAISVEFFNTQAVTNQSWRGLCL